MIDEKKRIVTCDYCRQKITDEAWHDENGDIYCSPEHLAYAQGAMNVPVGDLLPPKKARSEPEEDRFDLKRWAQEYEKQVAKTGVMRHG